MLTRLDGYKTYLAALAMAISGIASLIDAASNGGDFNAGIRQLLEAAAIAGLRHGVTRHGNGS